MDEIFVEFWTTLKEYIPAKDRQTAADHAVNLLSDSGVSDDVLNALKGTDKYMKNAVIDVIGEDDEDEYEDWDE
jgi:hypothetical protein